MKTPPSPSRRPLKTLAAFAGGAAALLVLAGCATSAASEQTATPAATDQPQQQGGFDQDRAGVSGLIAYAQDGTLQVQASDAQTAVRYTDDTTVSKTVSTDVSAIAVGDCVMAVVDEDTQTATTITVTAASDDGTCTSGFGGGQMPGGDLPEGGMPSGAPSGAPDGAGMPSGAPSGMPSGGTDGGGMPSGGGFGQLTVGAVTAVSDSTVTVEAVGQDDETTTTEVAVDADTVVTTTEEADASAVEVGLCVTAMGTADDSGGYDATSLTLSDPDENGDCSTGFGGFGGGRPDQGGTDE
ncbi:hypothetical protein ACFQRL_12925 [Microbacterium fluvii]|uniref:DUF5666 domain-containing protein n=1 Tax=Microbacterium fluvii TaxID=415215 RepID=A0ABW2HEX7_9MICO|nr:hypothetical protein [Microbacterium fluvii]MCU4673498.1 hypothetical protein [Microbacterium fluvii]